MGWGAAEEEESFERMLNMYVRLKPQIVDLPPVDKVCLLLPVAHFAAEKEETVGNTDYLCSSRLLSKVLQSYAFTFN